MCSYSNEQDNQKNAIQEDLKSPDYNIRTFFIIYRTKYQIKNKDKV